MPDVMDKSVLELHGVRKSYREDDGAVLAVIQIGRFTVGAGDAPGGGAALVSLRLYDVSGRVVAVLKEGKLSAGRYSVTWNGLENTGRAVASGIYFARLRVGDRVFVRKVVLAR